MSEVITAVYEISAEDPAGRAAQVAVEQSHELPTELAPGNAVRDSLARVRSVLRRPGLAALATIDYPVDLAGAEFGQLLVVLLGNVSLLDGVRLVDVALPARLAAALPALRDLAGQLGNDLRVSHRSYTAVTEEGRKYQEEAVLLYRTQWRGSDGDPQFGVGMGQRAEGKYFDPFEINKRPFCGVWAEDPQARTILGEGKGNRGWCDWAWRESIEPAPSDVDEDFLAYYAELVKREGRRIWLDYNGEIDGIANQAPS